MPTTSCTHPNVSIFIATAVLITVATCDLTSLSEPSPDLLWRSFNGSYITAYGGQPQYKLSHATAQAHCNKQGGNLLTIWDKKRNDFLKKSFATLLWVGLECNATSRSCHWADGKAVADSSTWLDGEPRVVNSAGQVRQCGAAVSILVNKQIVFSLVSSSAGLTDSGSSNNPPMEGRPQYLTAFSCDAQLGFFCNTETRPPNATAVYQHRGGWYSMFRSPLLTQRQAELYCRAYGGSLLQPHSRDDALTVFKLFLYQGYWIGAKGVTTGARASMVWEDGRGVLAMTCIACCCSISPTSWAVWGRQDEVAISSINGVSTCVSFTAFTADWYWQDCNLQLQLVCETPAEKNRHQGLVVEAYGATYYFFARPLAFQAARGVCRSINGAHADLAVIGSREENREVACRAGMLLRGLPYYLGHQGDNRTVLNTTAAPYPDPGHPGRWVPGGCMLAGWVGGGRVESSWLNENWWPVSCSEPHAFVCKSGHFSPSISAPNGHFSSPSITPGSIPSPSPPFNASVGAPRRQPSSPAGSSKCCSPSVRWAIGGGAAGCVLLASLLLGGVLLWKAARKDKALPPTLCKAFFPPSHHSSPSRRARFGPPSSPPRQEAPPALATAARHSTVCGLAHNELPIQAQLNARLDCGGASAAPQGAHAAASSSSSSSSSISAAVPHPTALHSAEGGAFTAATAATLGLSSRSAAAGAAGGGVDMSLQLEGGDVEVQWSRLLGRGTSGAVYAGHLRGAAVALKVLRREPTDSWHHDSSRCGSRRNSQCAPEASLPEAATAVAAAAAVEAGLRLEVSGGSGGSHAGQRHPGTAAALKLGNFRQEALILTHLRHPNVVALRGGCLEGRDVFLAYELCECSLADLLHSRSARPLPLERVLEITRGVACGLWQLHPHIIHCDLKSANVLLDAQGTAKISDFGVAHISSSGLPTTAAAPGHIAGTLPYMAPERLQGCPITDKTDIYAVGVLLWECLARQKPWHGLDKLSIIYQVCMERKRPAIPAEDVATWPPEVCTLIQRCWSHDLRDRPSAAELVKRLSALLARLRLGDPLRGRPAPSRTSPPAAAASSCVLNPAAQLALGAGVGHGADGQQVPSCSALLPAADGTGLEPSRQGRRSSNLVDPQLLLQGEELGGSGSDSSAMFSTGSFSQPLAD